MSYVIKNKQSRSASRQFQNHRSYQIHVRKNIKTHVMKENKVDSKQVTLKIQNIHTPIMLDSPQKIQEKRSKSQQMSKQFQRFKKNVNKFQSKLLGTSQHNSSALKDLSIIMTKSHQKRRQQSYSFDKRRQNFHKRKVIISKYKGSEDKVQSSRESHLSATNFLLSFDSSFAFNYASYINFIRSSPSNSYKTTYNFSFISSVEKQTLSKYLNSQNNKFILSLFKCIYQNLSSSSRETSAEAKTLIIQYCKLYASCFQKIYNEVVLKVYLKDLQFKILPIFVYQRLAAYICFLATSKDQTQLNEILRKILVCIIESLEKIQIIYNYLLLDYNLQSSRINQTFKILKIVAEVDRNVQKIQHETQKILKHGDQKIIQIEKLLKNFMMKKQNDLQNLVKIQSWINWKYLKIPPIPYLPNKNKSKEYTIVLDLEDTLVSYVKETQQIIERPFLHVFLKSLKQKFQVIAFTSSSKGFADFIVDEMEKRQVYFDCRLYKEHISLYNGRQIKDLSKMGRDMKKIIIIDNLAVNFCNCPDNGIEIHQWQQHQEDQILLLLTAFLTEMVASNVQDVRLFLHNHRKKLASFC